MSRYELTAATDPALLVAVGWDPPLHTYFGQVIDPRLDDQDGDEDVDPVLFWTGARFGEHAEPDTVIAMLAPWIKIGDELRQQLLADRDGDRRP